MVPPCHAPRQPLPDYPPGHPGGATPWPAEEMLDKQCQRLDVADHAGTAHELLLAKTNKTEKQKLEEKLCRIISYVPPATESVKGLKEKLVMCVCVCVHVFLLFLSG